MKNKFTYPALHLAGWLLFFSPVVFFIYRTPQGYLSHQKLFTPEFLLFCANYLLLFYINTYFLFPQLYLKRKYLLYIAAILIMFIGVCYLRPFDMLASLNGNSAAGPPPGDVTGPGTIGDRQLDIVSIVLFLMVWAVSSALCFIKQWQLAVKKTAKVEAEKISAELSYLKAQINPHFLFNTLNSIYSLAIQKSDKTAEAIVKLSELMRYVIRDADNDTVSLEQDLNYISNYIDLQKTRLEDTTTIDFILKGNTTGKKIAPLILISFIENAFKYGVNPDEPSAIKIEISVTGNNLQMLVFNKKVKIFFGESENGTGIENARTRLQLLYPEKFILQIDDKEDSYSVDLLIKI